MFSMKMNRNFIILIIVMSIGAFSYSIFDVIFPLYLDYKGISLPNIGIIFALPILLFIIMRVIVGVEADKHGRKPFYSLAIITGSLTKFLFVLANSVWQFLLINVFEKISSAFNDSTDHLLIYESAPKKKTGSAFGTIRGILSVLSFVGTLIAGSLLVFLGYINTLVFCALFLVATIPIFLKFKEKRFSNKNNYSNILEIFDFRNLPRNLKVYTIADFFYEISMSMIFLFSIQLFLTKVFGVSPIVLSIVLAGYTFLYAMGSLFLGKLSDVHLPKRVYAYSCILSTIILLVIGFAPTVYLVSLLWVLLGIFLGIEGPASRKMMNMYARPKFRGRDTNISRAISGIGEFAGPLLAGYIGVYGFNPIFIVSGIFLVFSAFVMNLIKD